MALGGAKSYAYTTNDGHCDIKQKGITMDRNNSEIIDFDTYRNMVLNHVPIKSSKRHQFRWSDTTKDIITKFIDRSIRATIGEKRRVEGYDTVPFGYTEN
jgi:hypothetical protein